MHRTQETSVQALQQSDTLQQSARCKIVNALGNGKRYTCEELGQIIGAEHKTVSAAICALRDNGELIDSGDRRKTRSKRIAICWRLTNESDEARPVLKNGWHLWDADQPPSGVPFLIRDHQSVYHGATYMIDSEGALVRVLEAKWHEGTWHCTGSITGRTIETPLAWRPLPTA